ncbi:YagK/YfjJ domain-containing protein [Vibrio parahaemolyticus]
MLSHYSKVCVILLQLHQKEFSVCNTPISKFINQLKSKLEKHYKTKMGYVWVREQYEAHSQHYHIAIMLNGHTCQSSRGIDRVVKELWENIDKDNFSYRIKNRIYRPTRYEDDAEYRAAIMRMSYMAKKKGKTNFPYKVKANGSSHLRAKCANNR